MAIRTIIDVEKTKVLELKDLYLAAYLVALDVPLVGTRKLGRQVIFQLEDDGDLEVQVMGFHSGVGNVRGRAYADALRNLKGMVHSILGD